MNNHVFPRVKKAIALLGASIASAAAFAQEAVTVDLSAAGDAADAMKSAFTTLVSSKLVVASLAIVAALVVLWLIPKIPSMISLGKKR